MITIGHQELIPIGYAIVIAGVGFQLVVINYEMALQRVALYATRNTLKLEDFNDGKRIAFFK